LDDFKEAKHLGSTKVYERLGTLFSKKKDMQSAIENFTSAIKYDQKTPELFCNRGYSYFMNKDFEKAIKDYEQALVIDPNFVQAYHNRSIAYYEKGRCDAIKDCEKVLNIKSDYNEANVWLSYLKGLNHWNE
jgi:tetratricopeptide (TPR) repeat protein